MKPPPSPRRSRCSGQIVVLAAILMVVLLAFVGLVVDVGQVYAARQQLRNACDAAVAAGAAKLPSDTDSCLTYALQYYCANAGGTPPADLVSGVATSITGTGDTVTVTTPYGDSGEDARGCRVRVDARRVVPALFVRFVGLRSVPVNAYAVGQSRGQSTGGGGLVCLDSAPTRSLQITGNARVKVPNGSVWVNSSAPDALYIDGSSQVNAKRISIVGGYSKGWSTVLTPAPAAGQAARPDPLQSLPEPSPSGAPTYPGQSFPLQNPWRYEASISPGVYTGKLVFGHCKVFFNPGVYILKSGMTIESDAIVYGDGVTIYNESGALVSQGNSRCMLTPPTGGTYGGILVFQGRSNSSALTLSNSVGWAEEGTIYAPNATLNLTGNVQYTMDMVIARDVNVRNSCSLNLLAKLPTSASGSGSGGAIIE